MIFKRKRLWGLIALSIGIGILVATLLPAIGWVLMTAIFLIVAGVLLFKI